MKKQPGTPRQRGTRHHLPGKSAIFADGAPIERQGQIAGAVGVNVGNGDQDKAVGAAALDACAKHVAALGLS